MEDGWLESQGCGGKTQGRARLKLAVRGGKRLLLQE